MSGVSKSQLDILNYSVGKATPKMILEKFREIENKVDISISEFLKVGSTELKFSDLVDLKKIIESTLHIEGYDGVVITHGSNTMEESAYFLHLTLNTNLPVVFTSSMRPMNAFDSDVANNFYHACIVAANKASKSKGVLIVNNYKIFSARYVMKKDTLNVDSFGGYPIGSIDGNHRVIFHMQLSKRHTENSIFSKIEFKYLKNIEILYSYLNMGDIANTLLNPAITQGIVIAGMGGGSLPHTHLVKLNEYIKIGGIVAMSTRVPHGEVVQTHRMGDIIAVGNLNPQKARILLLLSMTIENRIKAIQDIFDKY